MKTAATFLLPDPVGAVLARLPAYPGSMLLAGLLNRVLAPKLPVDVCQTLLDRSLRIHVRDARLTFDFRWSGACFVALPGGRSSDLTISASAHDFLRLAQRQEDPDTLFFSRRLSMQGDTELGLMVKNTLDALEFPVFDLGPWAPRRMRERFAPGRPGADAGRHERGPS